MSVKFTLKIQILLVFKAELTKQVELVCALKATSPDSICFDL